MAISEFTLIKTYLNKPGLIPTDEQAKNLPLGIGDDCALIDLPANKLLALSMDTLVADIHFPAKADPALIAQRSLAVNLSDLAAMGAKPLAFTLSLTLPKADDSWMQSFSEGLEKMVHDYSCPLIGGDISKGSLSITIQVHGTIERELALKRSGAKSGDLVYVSGPLGGAGLAVTLMSNGMSLDKPDTQEIHQAYFQPRPRIELGQKCIGLASAAIDISDGLLADLSHIAERSRVGFELEAKSVPIAKQVKKIMTSMGDKTRGLNLALTAGDDYELAFTVPPKRIDELEKVSKELNMPLYKIGKVIEGSGVKCFDEFGKEIEFTKLGYQHF